LAELDRKLSASLRKTPTIISVKNCPPPKKKHPERKKFLKIAESTTF